MKLTFHDSLTFGCCQGYPGGIRSRFRRFLSSLRSKRISTQGSVSLGPGAGGHRLGPHGGLLMLRKVVFGSQSNFLVSILEFWWHPQNPYFSHFGSLLAAPRGVPGASGVPDLATFLAFWVNFLARRRPDDVSAPAGSQADLPK